jgi:enoyl-CoA hydratase/carnithine racemase
MTAQDVVLYEVVDRVAWVTLNRPHRLNAWTGRMHADYRSSLAIAEADDDVRVIVVTGAGRGFCAGADAAALERHVEAGAYDSGVQEDELANPGYGARPEFDHAFAFHYGVAKPIIAAINGPAAGVGLVLACFCDLRFAAAGVKLTTAHGKLGLPAEYGLSWVLPRLVGVTRAADLLLTSRTFLAEEAAEVGLVNRVLPGDELLDHVREQARVLAHEVSPASLRETKRRLYADLHGDVGSAVAVSEELLERMVREGGADLAEGVAALREKRPPLF